MEATQALIESGLGWVTTVILAGVIVFLFKYYTAIVKLKDARIDELQELRLQDSKEVTKDVTAVIQGNSQNMALLSEKIEFSKRGV